MYKASALVVLAVVSVLSPVHAQSTSPGDTWQQWLRDVGLLIAPKEREAFLALPGDAERRAFAERFWQVRDPFPETPRNELQERWSSGLAEARSRWGTLDDDRSRVFLLQGEPSSGFTARCEGIAGELELWAYEPRFRVKHRSLVVFERQAQGPARIWRPAGDTLPASAQCSGGERLAPELLWLKMVGAEHYRSSVERALLRPKPRQADWYESLVALVPAVPAGEAPSGTFDAGLQVDYPGQVEERRVVRVMMTVPPGSLRPPLPMTAAAGAGGAQDLVLTGQVLRDREVLESFRYKFRVHPEAVEGQGIPLAFERYLLPGFYHLRIKLENLFSKSSFQGERELAVPGPQGKVARALAPPAAPHSAPDGAPGLPDMAGLYSEAAASLGAREPGLHLFGPADNLLIGNIRFEARIDEQPDLPESERVDRVAFLLDGRRILTRNRPPYAVTLDLGPVPRSRTLRVEGLSRDGRVLAADELALNAGAQRFAVQLLEPRPDRAYRRSLRARAEVEPPAGQSVERVEFYFNEDLVATLYQPPFSQPIALPGKDASAGYVRAVAYLSDGLSSEDVVILNAPESPDAMDVRLVELYTAVMDEAGRPVEGLAGGDFQVAEDGVRQTLRRVERVTDIPVRVVELIDNS
ncbi:MAG TPA: GWxTD domain-containing protein, partial [Thermoanaerobaculia bacterium]|nr:GWxTD domain-containing protein [Thermoanaerobaculia bacterium]